MPFGLCGHLHSLAHAYTQIHIHIKINKIFKKRERVGKKRTMAMVTSNFRSHILQHGYGEHEASEVVKRVKAHSTTPKGMSSIPHTLTVGGHN